MPMLELNLFNVVTRFKIYFARGELVLSKGLFQTHLHTYAIIAAQTDTHTASHPRYTCCFSKGILFDIDKQLKMCAYALSRYVSSRCVYV